MAVLSWVEPLLRLSITKFCCTEFLQKRPGKLSCSTSSAPSRYSQQPDFSTFALLFIHVVSTRLCMEKASLISQALDPKPHESLRHSPFLKWTELSRGLQESVEGIHMTHVRLHFEVYHGEQV